MTLRWVLSLLLWIFFTRLCSLLPRRLPEY